MSATTAHRPTVMLSASLPDADPMPHLDGSDRATGQGWLLFALALKADLDAGLASDQLITVEARQ